MIHYLLMIPAFLVDFMLQALFPTVFDMSQMYFVPSVSFCVMVLTIRKMERLDSYLFCIFFGFIYDFIYTDSIFSCAILYAIICFVVRVWMKHINNSVFENILLCISTLFLKEGMIYCYMLVSNQTTIGMNEWLTNRMYLTILVNALLVTFIVFLTYFRDDYLLQREAKIRREEKLPWMRLQLSIVKTSIPLRV